MLNLHVFSITQRLIFFEYRELKKTSFYPKHILELGLSDQQYFINIHVFKAWKKQTNIKLPDTPLQLSSPVLLCKIHKALTEREQDGKKLISLKNILYQFVTISRS